MVEDEAHGDGTRGSGDGVDAPGVAVEFAETAEAEVAREEVGDGVGFGSHANSDEDGAEQSKPGGVREQDEHETESAD